jgi:glycosyltransferase involved in cell wall biosynthesis
LQLSTSEGFPNSLAEAMLCGCVPIGSAVGDIPNIIGDAGFILERKNTLKLTSIIKSLDSINFDFLRKKARERVSSNFTYERRKEKLLALFN